jgi:hypothetical protein
MKTCGNCKWHREQGYTGNIPNRNIQCVHRKANMYFPLIDSVCDRWKPLTYFDAMVALREAVDELKAVIKNELLNRLGNIRN